MSSAHRRWVLCLALVLPLLALAEAKLSGTPTAGFTGRGPGGFTLEGFGSAWVDSIDGNSGTITGLSIPLLRRLLRVLGFEIVDLWTTPGHPDA